MPGGRGDGNKSEQKEKLSSDAPTAGLSQTTENSGARVALQSYLRLSWDEQVFIFPLNQLWDMGPLRRVDFGQDGSAVGAELKGADGW